MVDNERLLMDVARAVLAREGAELWKVEPGEFWCYLTPPAHRDRDQGWKLHVSATTLAAPVVLARVAEVLVRAGCAFKFARGLDQLQDMLAVNCDRGSGGKFITAYPADDEQFRRLAGELHRVTGGLPGPVILSDRRFRPGSNVFYRYGVFGAAPVFTNDGAFESVLTGPDGSRHVDVRQAWFSPPSWATPPFPEAASAGMPEAPASVLIGDRFVVREAIRHSYRGGVYRATDRDTGADVILKQARPHVASQLTGEDARDTLRHEATILDMLGPAGLAPRKIALLTHQENLFLAEELVPGVTLRHWAAVRAAECADRGVPLAEALDKAGRLARLMADVHERGLVLRDFNPNNIMVTPDGRLCLIDVEFLAHNGSQVYRAFTPAYAGPEVTSAPLFGTAPAPESDLYSLGATVCYLVSGTHPLLPKDEPAQRPNHERVANLVDHLAASMPALHRLAPMVRGLMHDDPDQRWSLARVLEFLTAAGTAVIPAAESDPENDRLIADGLDHMLRTMAPDGPRLWSGNLFGRSTDPCNVQHGAAGILHVLTRGARVLDLDRLRTGVATAAGWIRGHLADVPTDLPGLYFGRSGTAWALHEAAVLLDDEELAARAVDLAKRVPVEWPNPDICHGAAGAGMLQFRLFALTGDPSLQQRAIQAADSVLHAARVRDGRMMWPIPDTFDSRLAGLVHYGFAHGVAGAGAFLLYSGLATGKPDYLEAAVGAGDTLAAVAEVEDGAAWWPASQGEPARPGMWHWCSGSSGVGTFLIRLWSVTGDQRYRELAEAAGAAVHRDRWHCGISACHGLAGDGDFLLDLAEFTGEPRFRDWAEDMAAAMHARNVLRDGLMVLPDELGTEVHPGYNTGLGGAVDFLLRLRHGGPRSWLLDELLAGQE